MQHESPPLPQVAGTVVPDRSHRPARGHRARGPRPRRRRDAEPSSRARGQGSRRQHRADARLQRLHPRPHPARPAGVGGDRQRHQRRRPGHHRALARAATGQQVRRRPARDPAADPGRRQLHLPHPLPRPRPVLVPPAHPGGLHPGDGPLRQHPGRARRTRLLAAGQPGPGAHPGRRAARGRQDRVLLGLGDQLRRHGPVRERAAHRRRDRPGGDGASRRGAPAVVDQHRQHPRLQRPAARRPDEARRRGQRPDGARGVRLRGPAGAVRARGRRRPGRPARAADPGTPHPEPHLPPGVDHRDRGAGGAVAGRPVPPAGRAHRSWPRSVSTSTPG